MNKKRKVTCPVCKNDRIITLSSNILERVCMSCSKKVDRKILHYFDLIDKPSKAYIFGFLWADGWTNRHSIRVELQQRDKSVLEFIRNEIGAGTIMYRKRNDKRFKKDTESYTFSVSSTYLCRKLQELNFRKSIDKVDRTMWLDFLRGFLDGDGSIGCYIKGKKLSVSFASNINERWEHIREILNYYNVSYIIDRRKTGSNLRILGSDVSKIAFLEKLYLTDSFFLQRKRDQFEKYKACKIPRWPTKTN